MYHALAMLAVACDDAHFARAMLSWPAGRPAGFSFSPKHLRVALTGTGTLERSAYAGGL